MPLVYSSNSPQYFEYLAQNYTMDELKNDPMMCSLLENPDIKENAELAYKYKDALTGDYEDKKDFIEYYLCNGPELDTDTLLYYRNKIISNPELIEIATTTFNDTEYVTTLRYEKYGKEVSSLNGNCFTDPCSYLGPFSNALGISWDSKTFSTFNNVISKYKKDVESSDNGSKVESARPQPPGSKALNNLLPIETNDAVVKYTVYRTETAKKNILSNSIKNLKHFIACGDSYIIDKVEKICDLGRLKIHSNLGDCARLFNHARLYNPSNPSQNFQVPLSIPAEKFYPFGEPRYKMNKNTDTFASPNMNAQISASSVYTGENIYAGYDYLGNTELNQNKEISVKWYPYGNLIANNSTSSDKILYYNNNYQVSGTVLSNGVWDIPKDLTSLQSYVTTSNGEGKLDVGCYISLNNIREYFSKFYSSTISEKQIETLYANGLIGASIRYATSSFINNKASSSHICLQVIGQYKLDEKESGIKCIGITPYALINNNSSALTLKSTDGNDISQNIYGEMKQENGEYHLNLSINSKDFINEVSSSYPYTYTFANENEAKLKLYIRDKQQAESILGVTIDNVDIFDKGENDGYISRNEVSYTGDGSWQWVIINAIKIVTAYETGGDFRTQEVLADGAGITFGIMCTTQASGNLKKFLLNYFLPSGQTITDSNTINQWCNAINNLSIKPSQTRGSTTNAKRFEQELKSTSFGNTTLWGYLSNLARDSHMQKSQLSFFIGTYMQESVNLMSRFSFKSPLGFLFCFMTKIHGVNWTSGTLSGSTERERLISANYKQYSFCWNSSNRALKSSAARYIAYARVLSNGDLNNVNSNTFPVYRSKDGSSTTSIDGKVFNFYKYYEDNESRQSANNILISPNSLPEEVNSIISSINSIK